MKADIFEIFRTFSRYLEKKLGFCGNIFSRFFLIFVSRLNFCSHIIMVISARLLRRSKAAPRRSQKWMVTYHMGFCRFSPHCDRVFGPWDVNE